MIVKHVKQMKKTFIAVRDVDEETFQKFKEASMKERMKLGIALTLAMKTWLKERLIKEKKKKGIKHLLEIEPFDWGPGTESISQDIDEILYGGK